MARLQLLALATFCAVSAVSCGSLPEKFDCVGNCNYVCRAPADSCSDTEPCCPGTSCFNHVCQCSAEHESCSGADAGPNGQICCGGLECDPTGHCVPPCTLPSGACRAFHDVCTGDADCCAPGKCTQGRCNDPSIAPTCSAEGQHCATAADCCGATAFGSRYDCVGAADAGVCRFGFTGDTCDTTARHCNPGLSCIFPVVDAGGPIDAGTTDAGTVDAGDVDAGDAGDVDAGELDAGNPPDAGGPVDAGPPVGTCDIVKTGNHCTLRTANCASGDSCDPSEATNQGYDPCFLKVSGQSLAYRASPQFCRSNGFCSAPGEGEPCTSQCLQTPGDKRRTVCAAFFDGSGQCMPSCSTDADCRGATISDQQLANPQPTTNYCVNYGNTAGCQPVLCFIEGQAGEDDPGVLYKPCPGKPDSLCLPRFVGSVSTILGFCTATRSGSDPTVGQTCDVNAGTEAMSATCGKDATCLGGRCAPICDAAQLGDNNTPACDTSHSCISAQGIDLVADYQYGGCGTPCDPFASLESSGCVNFCGGPATRCEWLYTDAAGDAPRGYCAAAAKTPVPVGAACTRAAVDPCEAGSVCLGSSDGTTHTCTKLCDPTMSSGPDTCPAGKTCAAFASLKRSGYCR